MQVKRNANQLLYCFHPLQSLEECQSHFLNSLPNKIWFCSNIADMGLFVSSVSSVTPARLLLFSFGQCSKAEERLSKQTWQPAMPLPSVFID